MLSILTTHTNDDDNNKEGQEETSGGNDSVYAYADGGDGFKGVYISSNSPSCVC